MTKRSLRAAQKGVALSLVPRHEAPFTPIEPPSAARHAPSVYLSTLAESSRRAQKGALSKIAGIASDGVCDFHTMPWGDIRHEHMAAIRAILSSTCAPATAKRQMAALRGTINAAWRLEQIDTESRARALDIAPVRGQSLPRGRALSRSEVRAVFDVCGEDASVTGTRDAALLAVALGAGLRRGELVALDLSDYDPSDGALQVRRGKGNKGRVCYLGSSGRQVLDYWLEVRGKKGGALFHPLSRGGRILRRRLNSETFATVCKRRGEEAGLRPFSAHDCRRTFISNLLDAGVDIATVQKLAGHASPTTTAKYDRRGEEAKQKAAEELFIPFHKPKRVPSQPKLPRAAAKISKSAGTSKRGAIARN